MFPKSWQDRRAAERRSPFYRCHRGYIVNLDYVEQIREVMLLKEISVFPTGSETNEK